MMKNEMNTVDKGFELRYSRLSHRRKFIRTLWITVIGMVIVSLLNVNMVNAGIHPFNSGVFRGFSCVGILLLILITGVTQMLSEYKKWKAKA